MSCSPGPPAASAMSDVPIHVPAAPILSVSSTLTDRTDRSADKSIATNYDYTQYAPLTCSELYGLANVNQSFNEECQDNDFAQELTPVNNNKSQKNIKNCQTMYSTATGKPDLIKGVAKDIPAIADERSDAGETIEAGPSSKRGLKDGQPNTYYVDVVVDEYKAVEDGGKSGKVTMFQRARLAKTRIVGKMNKKRGVKKSVTDHGDTSKQVSFISRLKGKGKQASKESAKKDIPSSPEALAYVPSMLTLTSSPPDIDNVTPSGLNPDLNAAKLSGIPPQMPSGNNSVSSSMWKTKEDDDASHTDVTHASDSSRGSPTNSPLRNDNEATLVIPGVDGDAASVASGKKDSDPLTDKVFCEMIGKSRPLDREESLKVVVDSIDEEKLSKEAVPGEGSRSGSSTESIKTEETSKDDKSAKFDGEPSMKVFIDPLVSENENEIEMEYLGIPLPVMIHKEDESASSDPVPSPNVQESKCESPALPTEPVLLEVKPSKCNDSVTTVSSKRLEKSSSNKGTPIDSSVPNSVSEPVPVQEDKTEETQNEGNQTKHTKPKRGLTLTSPKLSRERIKTLGLRGYERLHSPRSPVENEVEADKVAEEDVVGSTPAIEVKPYYEPDFSVRTKHAIVEALKYNVQTQESIDDLSSKSASKSVTSDASADGNVAETVQGDPPAKNTSQPVELSKIISVKNKRRVKNLTSFDDTLFEGVSLTSDNGMSLAGSIIDDGTAQESCVIDHNDDQSESSFTFVSGDSTYHSETTEHTEGCGRSLFQDLNDVVEDFKGMVGRGQR